MAASRACTEPSGITCMPSRPQPCWRDSSRLSQSVSEPAVVTPMRLPLRSAMVLIGDLASTTTARFDGAPYIAATPIAGTPLARKPSPGPEPSDDVDRAGGEAGLHLRVALEARDRELDAFLLEDAGLHADVGRGEGPGIRDRLADAELVLRQRGSRSRATQPPAATAATDLGLGIGSIKYASRRCARRSAGKRVAFPRILRDYRDDALKIKPRRPAPTALQFRHHLAREQLDRALRFRQRQIAKRELPDAIIAAGRGELLAQECHHGARRARDTLPHLGDAVEIRRPRMRGRAVVQPVQVGEARVPSRIGAARERQRLGVGVGDDDETAEPHQRQRRVAPGLAPGVAEGVERRARRRHRIEADRRCRPLVRGAPGAFGRMQRRTRPADTASAAAQAPSARCRT